MLYTIIIHIYKLKVSKREEAKRRHAKLSKKRCSGLTTRESAREKGLSGSVGRGCFVPTFVEILDEGIIVIVAGGEEGSL